MGNFIPPPPFLPGDRRPPPLGRMSSPPLGNQFSPPPPVDYSIKQISSPSLSPHSKNFISNEIDAEREQNRHRNLPYPPLHRGWEGSPESQGFVPISNQKQSKKDRKG